MITLRSEQLDDGSYTFYYAKTRTKILIWLAKYGNINKKYYETISKDDFITWIYNKNRNRWFPIDFDHEISDS